MGGRWQRWQKEGSSVRWVSNGLLAHQPYLVGRLSAKLCIIILQPDSVDFDSLVGQFIQKEKCSVLLLRYLSQYSQFSLMSLFGGKRHIVPQRMLFKCTFAVP